MKYKVRLQRSFGGFGFGVWRNGWPWLTICIGPFTWRVTRKTRKPEHMCEFAVPGGKSGDHIMLVLFAKDGEPLTREESLRLLRERVGPRMSNTRPVPPPQEDEDSALVCCVSGRPLSHERRSEQEPPEAEYDSDGNAYHPDFWDYEHDQPAREV